MRPPAGGALAVPHHLFELVAVARLSRPIRVRDGGRGRPATTWAGATSAWLRVRPLPLPVSRAATARRGRVSAGPRRSPLLSRCLYGWDRHPGLAGVPCRRHQSHRSSDSVRQGRQLGPDDRADRTGCSVRTRRRDRRDRSPGNTIFQRPRHVVVDHESHVRFVDTHSEMHSWQPWHGRHLTLNWSRRSRRRPGTYPAVILRHAAVDAIEEQP